MGGVVDCDGCGFEDCLFAVWLVVSLDDGDGAGFGSLWRDGDGAVDGLVECFLLRVLPFSDFGHWW